MLFAFRGRKGSLTTGDPDLSQRGSQCRHGGQNRQYRGGLKGFQGRRKEDQDKSQPMCFNFSTDEVHPCEENNDWGSNF